MAEPKQKPGRSKQDYGTPADFLEAVKARLGIRQFVYDLAAREENTKAPHYISPLADSLLCDWRPLVWFGWGWLNPPYGHIAPWAAKCARLRKDGGRVAFLVPAAIGSNWYRDHVHGHALVLALNGRLTFEGCTAPFPKDCILALYSPDIKPGFDVWKWKDRPAAQGQAVIVARGTGMTYDERQIRSVLTYCLVCHRHYYATSPRTVCLVCQREAGKADPARILKSEGSQATGSATERKVG